MEPTTAPRHAEIIRAFVNTRDLEDGTEALADGAALTAWLGEQGLSPPGAAAGDGDAALARELREALRDLLTARHDDAVEPAAQRRLDALAADLPLRVDFAGQLPALAPLGAGSRAGLAGVLAAVGHAAADGSWPRLKVCPADDCRWAFYDTSRNRSRTWCSMQVCGNRTKTRAYRSRRRFGDGGGEDGPHG
ncbi:MAG TPA: CGNR zinc finger domain-containing protein [Jiangellales bacterium]|nr:CGNR zinc finger domain-containing protein [Jiangellales bacterium]